MARRSRLLEFAIGDERAESGQGKFRVTAVAKDDDQLEFEVLDEV